MFDMRLSAAAEALHEERNELYRQIAQGIVTALIEKTGIQLTIARVHHDDYYIVCNDDKGKMHVVKFGYICDNEGCTYFIRSLLKQINRRWSMHWYINGQAGKNSRELFWWPEGEFIYKHPVSRFRPLA